MEAGNVKEMREALAAINCVDTRKLKRLLCELVEADIPDGGQINKIISAVDKAKSALAAPPRNCDVGTASEQDDRMTLYCQTSKCEICPLWDNINNGVRCEFTWSQMPYEEGESK